jgi:hypothetical protein
LGFIEQMVEVDARDVFPPAGDYFLNVTPTGDLSGRSFDSSTMGANCIGTPCGNDQNVFFDSPSSEPSSPPLRTRVTL